MGYRNDDPLKMIQVIFQNRKRPDVQIIGRLIQKQDVGRPHQYMKQAESSFFPSRKFTD